ncbi:hypothetical protein FKP32DRAFT_1283281 [Trametes sanguinea]|nr:hypothetical protein FKP32DRAFT_1283281 [Trametes sanguinea]
MCCTCICARKLTLIRNTRQRCSLTIGIYRTRSVRRKRSITPFPRHAGSMNSVSRLTTHPRDPSATSRHPPISSVFSPQAVFHGIQNNLFRATEHSPDVPRDCPPSQPRRPRAQADTRLFRIRLGAGNARREDGNADRWGEGTSHGRMRACAQGHQGRCYASPCGASRSCARPASRLARFYERCCPPVKLCATRAAEATSVRMKGTAAAGGLLCRSRLSSFDCGQTFSIEGVGLYRMMTRGSSTPGSA